MLLPSGRSTDSRRTVGVHRWNRPMAGLVTGASTIRAPTGPREEPLTTPIDAQIPCTTRSPRRYRRGLESTPNRCGTDTHFSLPPDPVAFDWSLASRRSTDPVGPPQPCTSDVALPDSRRSRPRPPLYRRALPTLEALCDRLRVRYLLRFECKGRVRARKTKERYPATTYSPTPLPGQYHRRWWA